MRAPYSSRAPQAGAHFAYVYRCLPDDFRSMARRHGPRGRENRGIICKQLFAYETFALQQVRVA